MDLAQDSQVALESLGAYEEFYPFLLTLDIQTATLNSQMHIFPTHTAGW